MHAELKPGTGDMVLVYSPGEDEPTPRELRILSCADTILKEEVRKQEERFSLAEKAARDFGSLRDRAVAELDTVKAERDELQKRLAKQGNELREANAELSATNARLQRDIGIIQNICEWWGNQ